MLLEVRTRSLGLDVGDRRIGVAVGDPEGILASPFAIIERKDDNADAGAIVSIVKDQQVKQIIVGLPQSMSGNIGQQAVKVKAFVEVLRKYTEAPIEFRDERLTTVSAQRLKREAGTKKTRKKVEYDAIAAAIILQGYLDERRQYGEHSSSRDTD